MSTRIHNGYRLPEGLSDPARLSRWVGDVAARMRPVAVAALREEALRRAIGFFDYDAARAAGTIPDSGPAPAQSPWDRAWEQVRQEVIQARRDNRYCRLDPYTELAVIADGAQLYARLFAEQPALIEVFSALPGVSPYPYWNHTDGPGELTDEQWRARGEHWERLLGPTGITADVASLHELVPHSALDEVALDGWLADAPVSLLASEPDLHARAHRLALHTPQSQPDPPIQSPGMAAWVRHEMALFEGKAPAFNRVRQALRAALEPAPTLARLCRPPAPPAPSP